MAAAADAPRRLAWIEAARAVSMCAVVWTHANNTAFYREGDFSLAPLFASTLVCFAVPTFFIISGYLTGLYEAARPPGEPFSLRPARRMARLVPPFLAWNAISLVILKLLYGVPLATLSGLLDLATGAFQLYFIFALLQILALLRLFNPFATPRRLALTTLFAAASTLLFYAFSTLLFHLSPPRDFRFEMVGIRLAPAWAGFFFLGAWLSRHPGVLEGLCRRLPWLWGASLLALAAALARIVSQAALLGANYRQYFLLSGLAFQTVAALTVLCACRRAEPRAGILFSALARLGGETLGIYLSHYCFVLAFYALVPPPVPPGLRLPLGLAATCVALGGGLLATRRARRHAPSPLSRLLFAA